MSKNESVPSILLSRSSTAHKSAMNPPPPIEFKLYQIVKNYVMGEISADNLLLTANFNIKSICN